MYAHTAIKNLIEYGTITEVGDDILSLIKESTKYHFGSMASNIYSIMLPIVEKYEKETGHKFKPFESQMEGVVSPFDTVWFEWTVEDRPLLPKYASLILKSESPTNPKEDLLTIYSFIFQGDNKKWRFVPILSKVDMAIKEAATYWMHTDEYTKRIPQRDQDELKKINKYCLSCISLCLRFLNCRNVEVIKRIPDEKLQKKRKKYGKQPMFTYHILEIKDMRKKNIYPDDHTPTKMGKLRHHQMPARVAYYTADKPLFGNPKLTGWYAFKSHWRGDPNKGTIIRDYETEKKGDN